MRKFVGSIGTNKVGSEVSFEFEVPDDASDEEIEECAREAAFNCIDWYFTEITGED